MSCLVNFEILTGIEVTKHIHTVRNIVDDAFVIGRLSELSQSSIISVLYNLEGFQIELTGQGVLPIILEVFTDIEIRLEIYHFTVILRILYSSVTDTVAVSLFCGFLPSLPLIYEIVGCRINLGMRIDASGEDQNNR